MWQRRVQVASVLVVIIAAARLIVLARLWLIVIALPIALIVRRLLLVDLCAVDAAGRARCRIACTGVAAISGIDVIVVLRHVAARGRGLRRQIHRLAGRAVLLLVGRLCGAGYRIGGAAARIAS